MDEKIKARYLKDIEYFSKKLEENPDSKVFMPLAIAYLKLGKYDEVIDVCIKGLDKNPNYLAAKTVLAQAYLEKGLINEAKALLVEVATIDKNNYRANKLLGDIYRAENNLEKALFHYRSAYVVSPEDNDLKELIEEFAEKIDAVPKTEEELEEIEKLAETAKEVTEDLGEEFSNVDELTQKEEAVSEFEVVKVEETESVKEDEEVELAEDLEEGKELSDRKEDEESIDDLLDESLKIETEIDEGEAIKEEQKIDSKNAKIVEELEKWLDNIRKVKESRSV
ncbi:hypothetical protein OWM07_00430 [Deferribacter thermophilus]|uniref:tetratricopeptide repeat protein n=1 Tax=Deferribacter thermophilus TaxID=53573 RepID=UPI003C1A74AB